MYYWAIKWKQFGQEDLYVNDKQKEYIENEWVKEPTLRKAQTFKINGEIYSFNSIDSITRTTKRIENNTKLLYAAEAALKSKDPLTNDDGDVVTNWYKRLVNIKEFEKYYSPHHYPVVEQIDGGFWIGMRLVEYENGYHPDNVELCTREEADKLWNRLTAYS